MTETAERIVEDGGDRGGRVYFSGASRSLVEEDEIRLVSVGVDIGSSTAHLMFSRITLERSDTRYIVSEREVLYQSEILLTPYRADGDIDTDVLARFIEAEYGNSGISRDEVDSGALILTGVAVRRRNARAIGELFAGEAGKFVSVSAGDSLETLMAANGSGAVAASAGGRTILNVDVGGGTTKLAICRDGEIVAMTAVEAGARLLVTDADDRVIRLETYGTESAASAGLTAAMGAPFSPAQKDMLAGALADRILAASRGQVADRWLRLPSLPEGVALDGVIFSGGVSEYIYGGTVQAFDDLGPDLGRHLRARFDAAGLAILPHADGIRATVIGASQYTVQLSGSTVFFDPEEVLPIRNLATIRPLLDLSGEDLDPEVIATAVRGALRRLDLHHGDRPVAIALAWQGSATYHRLDALSRGLIAGLDVLLGQGHPLAIVADGDIGGLLGMHCRENELLPNPIISVDGITLSDFDFVDIGEVILATGSVPVVIKSLVFPGDTGPAPEENGDD